MPTELNPQPSPLDLTQLLAAATKFSGQIDKQSTQLQGIYKNAGNAEETAAQVYETIGQNNVIIDSAKNTADLAVQRAKIETARKLGTDLKFSSDTYTALIDTVNSQYAEKAEALKTIQAKQSVGFFDNPLEWVMNQITVNDDIARHNAANQRGEAAVQQIETLNKLTQQTNLTQTQLSESLNEAAVKASADNAALNAKILADKARINGMMYNAEGIKAALSATKEQLGLQFSIFGAQKQEQQINIALATLDLHRQEFDWRKEEKQKGKDADDYFIDRINDGMRLRLGEGAPLIEKGSAKASQIVSLLKSNSPAGKIYQEDYLIGEQSLVSGTKVIAPSAARAIEILNSVPVKLSSAQEPVRALLNQALQETQQLIATGKIDPKNKALVEATLNDRAKQLLEEQAKVVKPGDYDNVFNFQGVGALISQSPTLQKLPVVQKVIAPAVATGVDLNDPTKVFGLVGAALQKGTISYKEAIELSTIYSQAQSVNMEAKQLVSLGLTPKFSYNVKLNTDPNSTMFRSEVVDLTKPDLVGRALNKYLASVQNPFGRDLWR